MGGCAPWLLTSRQKRSKGTLRSGRQNKWTERHFPHCLQWPIRIFSQRCFRQVKCTREQDHAQTDIHTHAHQDAGARSVTRTGGGSQTPAGTQTDSGLAHTRRVRHRRSTYTALTDAYLVGQAGILKMGHRLVILQAIRQLSASAEEVGCSSTAARASELKGSGAVLVMQSAAVGSSRPTAAQSVDQDQVTPVQAGYDGLKDKGCHTKLFNAVLYKCADNLPAFKELVLKEQWQYLMVSTFPESQAIYNQGVHKD